MHAKQARSKKDQALFSCPRFVELFFLLALCAFPFSGHPPPPPSRFLCPRQTRQGPRRLVPAARQVVRSSPLAPAPRSSCPLSSLPDSSFAPSPFSVLRQSNMFPGRRKQQHQHQQQRQRNIYVITANPRPRNEAGSRSGRGGVSWLFSRSTTCARCSRPAARSRPWSTSCRFAHKAQGEEG